MGPEFSYCVDPYTQGFVAGYSFPVLLRNEERADEFLEIICKLYIKPL